MKELIFSTALLLLTAPLTTQAALAALELKGGVARRDITPPMAMKAALGGYGERMNKPAIGVHDRVWAKALVLSDGAKRYVLVTADLLGFPPGVKTAVAHALASEGWQDEQILLLPSHSHNSIDMSAINPKNDLNIPQIGLYQQELFDLTVANLVQVIRAASQELVPVAVGTDSLQLHGWCANRRAGNTATDPNLTLTRIDRVNGRPLAVLVHWAAHPTFLGAKDMVFSCDWPGVLQRALETLIGDGVMAMYYNGAQGDQSPVAHEEGVSGWEKVERYGVEMATLVYRAWGKIKPRPNPVFAYHTQPFDLPKPTWHPDFMRTGGEEYGMTPETVEHIITKTCPRATHSNALRLGDLVIVGIPGELASALGLSVKTQVGKALGVKRVVIGGLADEWVSYILSPEEYIKGGYEASISFYGPTLGPVIVAQAVKGAAKLRD